LDYQGLPDTDEENKFYLNGMIMLANYVINPQDVGIENLIINKSIYKNVNKFHTLGCKLDKVYETVDGLIEVIDYKSGKIIKHQDNFELDFISSTCIFLGQEWLNLRPDSLSYYYLKYNKKFTKHLTSNDIQKAYTNVYKHLKLLD
jgi:hypothetical protein